MANTMTPDELVEVVRKYVEAGMLLAPRGDELVEVVRKYVEAEMLLAPRGLVYVKLAEPHNPDSFYENREGLWVWGGYRSQVVAKAKPTPAGAEFSARSFELKRDMSDVGIESSLPDGHLFDEGVLCAIIADLISKQEGGKEGTLLNNGHANLFYTSSCVVFVYWSADNRVWSVDKDKQNLWLLEQVIDSFKSSSNIPTFSRILECSEGLPLGNPTSQLLVNIYMNEFDRYVKHELKVKYYIRYADDFVFLSHNKKDLEALLSQVSDFLVQNLKLALHPDKVFIKTFSSGIDFLGWVHFPKHRILRTATKRRMFRNVRKHYTPESTASYLGLLSHGNSYKLRIKLQRVSQGIKLEPKLKAASPDQSVWANDSFVCLAEYLLYLLKTNNSKL